MILLTRDKSSNANLNVHGYARKSQKELEDEQIRTIEVKTS